MARFPRGRRSLRDQLIDSHRASSWYALMADKPAPPAPELSPKRQRKRDDGSAVDIDAVHRKRTAQSVVPLEKEIQRAILDALSLRRDVIFVGRFNRGQAVERDGSGHTRYTPFNSVRGFPDIHGLLVGGRAFYVEVKRPPPYYTRPSDDQQRFLDEAKAGGAAAGVACSVEEAEAILAC